MSTTSQEDLLSCEVILGRAKAITRKNITNSLRPFRKLTFRCPERAEIVRIRLREENLMVPSLLWLHRKYHKMSKGIKPNRSKTQGCVNSNMYYSKSFKVISTHNAPRREKFPFYKTPYRFRYNTRDTKPDGTVKNAYLVCGL
jgi:hypothetical protein